MKKLMAVGLALILMTACSAEETATEEKSVEQSKVEEKEKTPAPEPQESSADYDKVVAGMLGGLSTTMTEFSQTLIDGSSDPLLIIICEWPRIFCKLNGSPPFII
jgi:hypothetical protein